MGKKHRREEETRTVRFTINDDKERKRIRLDVIIGEGLPETEFNCVADILSCVSIGLRMRGHHALITRPMKLPPE